MIAALLLAALLASLEGASGTISLFLPSAEKNNDYQEQYLQQPPTEYSASQQYSLQGQYNSQYSQSQPPVQTQDPQYSPVYWTGEQPAGSEEYQSEEDPAGYRYQSYQSTYQHQVQQNLPYPAAYPAAYPATPVYQPVIPQQSHLPTYQQLGEPVIVPASPLGPTPYRPAAPTSLPVYQLVTVGPEVPVLVRLPNQQTAILPVRTVYSLPSFLERIVQRVQNYYSIYNPLELPAHRQNETESSPAPASGGSSSTEAPSEPTTGVQGLSDRIAGGGEAGSTAKPSSEEDAVQTTVPPTTVPPTTVPPTTAESATTDPADNEVQETTTAK